MRKTKDIIILLTSHHAWIITRKCGTNSDAGIFSSSKDIILVYFSAVSLRKFIQ